MAGERPKVYSIPAGVPFLATLADAILEGRFGELPDRRDPLALADLTILLPTRRAVRAMREVFIEKLGGGAVIPPTIRPIGDVDEEGQLLDPEIESGAELLALPPAISRLTRQLALTRLTLAWGRAVRANRSVLHLRDDEPVLIPASATDATRLAADLARLMDDMETAGVPPEAIGRLAPEDQAGYFQITRDFLKIAFEHWPAHLASLGRVDPVKRRDTLIRAAAERLNVFKPTAPIIAAGSTGSIPATAELLKAIALLPNGAVVLPGLDQQLDDAGWAAIGGAGAVPAAAFGHPQFALKHLVGELGIAREDVVPLGREAASPAMRTKLLSEALRPAETTERWASFRAAELTAGSIAVALAGATLLVGQNEQEEAVGIAIAIREALEGGAATIAVVTPDRTIARRVAAELARWKLEVDDSAGARLDLLPEGVFVRLLVEAAASGGDAVNLLALLKHPFAAFGMERIECRRATRMLELAVLRGREVKGGAAALGEALARAKAEAAEDRHVPLARRRLNPSDWADAGRLVTRIETCLQPLEEAFRADADISASAATALVVEALRRAASDRDGLDTGLWQGDGGTTLAELLAGLVEEGDDLAMRPGDYPSFLATLLSEIVVARGPGGDPRVHIWGTLEARLQSVDLLILAGLDEGVWPTEVRTDPWLSRTMRTAIGLPPPERRIGLSAHDFAQGFAASQVIVSRSAKRGGAPTVASRWLQRLTALLGEEPTKLLKLRGDRFVDLARHIDRVEHVRPVRQPKPTPPVAARPRRLSVTEIETLVRDPYAIYARHILRLEPLDPLGRAPDYALRGSLIHDALGKFVDEWRGPFDNSAEARLLAIGRETLADIAEFPDVHAIWSIRFAGIAGWIVEWEAERDGEIAIRHGEIGGEMAIEAPAGPFHLRGRADRIDLRKDGALEILDFKTGTPPTATQVRVGFAPQLGLEAAMAKAGAFEGIAPGLPVAKLGWIGLGKIGRAEPFTSAVEKDWTADGIADEVLSQVRALITAFDDPLQAYTSQARPMFVTRYESPYDHLARLREWGLVESEEELAWLPAGRSA